MKLDFQNAFNSIHRDKMLEVTLALAPSLYPLVHSVYSSPSSLYWEDRILDSAEGVQQGDPLGPLLFCLTIHHLLSQLKSEFCVAYLDDVTLGGQLDEILQDVQRVEGAAGDYGLILNHHKFEIFCADPSTKLTTGDALPAAQVMDPASASLLGVSIGDMFSISATLGEKIDRLRTLGERLQLLSAHDTILLLRHSLSIPKLLYCLRSSPCFTVPMPQEL